MKARCKRCGEECTSAWVFAAHMASHAPEDQYWVTFWQVYVNAADQGLKWF